MFSENNKWLTVRQGVTLNDLLDMVIGSFDRWFEARSLKAEVSSGVRTPEHQLEIIKGFIINGGYADRFQELDGCGLDDVMDNPLDPSGPQIFKWQIAWSQLLCDYGRGYSTGRIVDPPRPAIVLLDYWHGGLNHKGHLINPSGHILGVDFDIDGNLDLIAKVLADILASKQVKQFCGYLVEPQNGSVHVDCRNV